MASPMGQLPQMEMVVDVVVCINGQNTTFQNLPAGISPRLSGLIPMVRKRSILADMWGRRCSLLPRSSYVNIAERDWKNNNRTEAFFDLLELPFLQVFIYTILSNIARIGKNLYNCKLTISYIGNISFITIFVIHSYIEDKYIILQML